MSNPVSKVQLQQNWDPLCTPYNLLGLLPKNTKAGSGTRLHPWSERPKPRRPTQEQIKQIQAAQKAVRDAEDQFAGGSEPEVAQSTWQEPPPLTSAASRTEPGLMMKWLNSWFWRDAPTVPDRHLRAGIVTFTFTNPETGEPYPVCEAVVKVLQKLFDPDQIHVLPAVKAWWYIRNVATTTPDGTLLTSEIKPNAKNREGLSEARDSIEAHFDKLGLPVKRLSTMVNFANVEYIKEKDLLIAANPWGSPLESWELWELKEAFGFPEHVVTLELDVSGQKAHSCYDLDLAFLFTRNDKGQIVALVYEDCLMPDSKGFGESLARQHDVLVIHISKEEQQALATNSVSNPDKPGKLLFTRDRIPDSLVRKLKHAGIHAVRPNPNSKVRIGLTEEERVIYDGNASSLYGLHCLTMNGGFPVDKVKSHDGL